MKIKKPMKVKPMAPVAHATGGATIADRFKLDVPAAPAAGSVSKPAAAVALAAGVLALLVSGILAFVLFNHLQSLTGA